MIILNLYGMSFDRVPDIYGQTILKGNRLLLYVMGKEIHHFSEPGQLVYESNYSEAGSIYIIVVLGSVGFWLRVHVLITLLYGSVLNICVVELYWFLFTYHGYR